jgi:hypothetical protein
MLIVLFVITLIICGLIICFIDDDFGLTTAFCILMPVGVLLLSLFFIDTVVDGRVADKKIKMYTEENNAIEKQIETVVNQYMEYENETLKEFKGDSSITLVTLYPELKSDELVKKQIETYQKNNEKIKELKEKKIEVSTAKWWLYFGK